MNQPSTPSFEEILFWLREEDPEKLQTLWDRADKVRSDCVGDTVHLRGLVEISNHCARQCAYCGIRAGNADIPRYRLTSEEVLDCANQALSFGYGTLVLQAGEDYGLSQAFISDLVRRIKSETGRAVTLSLGERSDEDLKVWREAGADRYLLRFETSNTDLFHRIHPPLGGQKTDRLAILHRIRNLGYEVGSGVMVGIPGQSYEDLARDILLFRELDLDMIGVGPFLPHPATPLGRGDAEAFPSSADQVPNTELMTYKVVALTRLVRPFCNIPSTTALASLNRESGRQLGLLRGANIVMPNLTPMRYRSLYEIYPAKACILESAESFHHALIQSIRDLGRTIGEGPGHSYNLSRR